MQEKSNIYKKGLQNILHWLTEIGKKYAFGTHNFNISVIEASVLKAKYILEEISRFNLFIRYVLLWQGEFEICWARKKNKLGIGLSGLVISDHLAA